MEWNTPVSIDLQQGAVTHHHRMMLFGSCFAEHIGTRLGFIFGSMSIRSVYSTIRCLLQSRWFACSTGSRFPMKTFFQTEIYGTVLPIIRAFHI